MEHDPESCPHQWLVAGGQEELRATCTVCGLSGWFGRSRDRGGRWTVHTRIERLTSRPGKAETYVEYPGHAMEVLQAVLSAPGVREFTTVAVNPLAMPPLRGIGWSE